MNPASRRAAGVQGTRAKQVAATFLGGRDAREGQILEGLPLRRAEGSALSALGRDDLRSSVGARNGSRMAETQSGSVHDSPAGAKGHIPIQPEPKKRFALCVQ
jgi:hypothetical protein